MQPTSSLLPLRAGAGLKPAHYSRVLERGTDESAPCWFEIHPQNYFCAGGPPHRWLGAIAELYPLSFHSTGLSLGSAEGVDEEQLARLADLAERYNPAQVSDHLSWSASGNEAVPDLLPLPYTSESFSVFASAVERVQDRLGRPILVENPSRYLAFANDEFEEPEFLARLCRTTGCGILLDLNNMFVSASNLGFSAQAWLDRIDPALVGEVHLAGHSREIHDCGDFLLDDHGSNVCDEVWDLFAGFIARAGPKPTLIEWDTRVPDFEVLAAEAAIADKILIEAPGHDRAAA